MFKVNNKDTRTKRLASVETPNQTNYTLVKENEHGTYTHNKIPFTEGLALLTHQTSHYAT